MASERRTAAATKVRENRLRRMAARQGLVLVKSRARDPRALDYQGFMLVDLYTNAVVYGVLDSRGGALDIDEVEAWLTSPER